MKISELIALLAQIAHEKGNIDISVRNRDGEWNPECSVVTTHYGRPLEPHWIAFIDSER